MRRTGGDGRSVGELNSVNRDGGDQPLASAGGSASQDLSRAAWPKLSTAHLISRRASRFEIYFFGYHQKGYGIVEHLVGFFERELIGWAIAVAAMSMIQPIVQNISRAISPW